MPHFDPPLRYKLTARPIEVFAGPNGQSYWIYRELLDCVLNAGELVRTAQGFFIDWKKYEYEVVGRVLEFLLQFDYSTVLETDEDVDANSSDVETDDTPLIVRDKPRSLASRKRKPGRPRKLASTNSVAAHDEAYRARWDSEEPAAEKSIIGPWSPIDAFLIDSVCKDWMMTIEGNIITDENTKELSHLAIVLHVKVYIFAFAHDFPLLRDVAIQKLVMCLSRIDCAEPIHTAIVTSDRLLEMAGFGAEEAEHRQVHDILEHYAALNIASFLRDQRVSNEPFVHRADAKLKLWQGKNIDLHAQLAKLMSENARLEAENAEHRRRSTCPEKEEQEEEADDVPAQALRSGRIPKKRRMQDL